MEALIEFAQHASPIMFSLLIIGGLVHVVLLLLKSSGLLGKVRGTQIVSTSTQIQEFDAINKKLDTVMNNHLHDLPVMQENVKIIKEDISEIKESMISMRDNFGNRLTRLETLIEKK